MAYRIDFSLSPGTLFYAEILLRDIKSKLPMSLAGVKHQMVGFSDDLICDYGELIPSGGTVIASNDTGEITVPATGLIVITIPASRFATYSRCCRSMRFNLTAIPTTRPDYTCLLAAGTITFGA